MTIIKQDPILITGCARSGTSIIAGTVQFCGAFGGDVQGATRYNAKGQFENKMIRDKITKPALRNAGFDPLGQYPLPTRAEMPIDPGWKKRVTDVMINQGYQSGPWYYKGAKMCLFWWQWADAFPNAKWIIVRRDADDIVNSCLKTGFMRAYKNASGWQGWIRWHLIRFNEMKQAGLDIIGIWPSRIIAGDYDEIKEVISHIGLVWNEKAVSDFITPRLWHGKVLANRSECK